MTRTERKRKLAAAIKDYRGSNVRGSNPVKWIRAPQPAAATRVRHWLAEVGVKDVDAAMQKIDSFTVIESMWKWLEEL